MFCHFGLDLLLACLPKPHQVKLEKGLVPFQYRQDKSLDFLVVRVNTQTLNIFEKYLEGEFSPFQSGRRSDRATVSAFCQRRQFSHFWHNSCEINSVIKILIFRSIQLGAHKEIQTIPNSCTAHTINIDSQFTKKGTVSLRLDIPISSYCKLSSKHFELISPNQQVEVCPWGCYGSWV